MAGEYSFPGITLMITHYNRSSSLQRLLKKFQDLNCRFDEIVVSDDCSKPENLEKVKQLQSSFNFRLVSTPNNKGIGGNINNGQDAVKTPYTLYVQEDFVPTPLFPAKLQDALKFMNEDKGLDLIRFWAHYRYPTLKPYGKGFAEMKYSSLNMSHLKFFMYSDTPHLRRSNFLEKFGRYKDRMSGDVGEYHMAISFLRHKGKALFFEEYSTLLTHENPEDEPSTQPRAGWRFSQNPAYLFARFLYLRLKWVKSTLDLQFFTFDTSNNNNK